MTLSGERVSPVRRFRAFVCGSRGWRRRLLALAAGSVSVLAFAPFFAWPVLFLTFPVFLWLVASSPSAGDAGRTAWIVGFGYFFFNFVWIGEAFLVEADKFAWLLPFAVTLLPAGLALFWAAAGWLLRRLDLSGLAGVVAFAVVMAAVAYARGHILTGLPWNVPGYALTAPLELLQSASIFGIYGLTLIACFVFAAPLVLAADDAQPWRMLTALAVSVLPIAALYGYGMVRLSAETEDVAGVKIRIVQPSVPQREKWLPEFQRRIFDDHILLSRTNPEGGIDDLAGITHVIWPESAMPFFPLETPQAMQEIADMLPEGRVLITGAIRRDSAAPASADTLQSWKVFNSILVLDDKAALIGLYDKIHLVPFGEYLPFDKTLEALGLQKLTHGRGAFTEGPRPKPPLKAPGLPAAVGLICYEAVFPEEVVAGGARPGVIVNVTNDGWFGNSTGPRQHFQQTRVRAVEQGVPVLRAANNGISAIVDPYGRVRAALGMDARGVIDGALPRAISAPPYAVWGNWIFAAMEFLSTVLLLVLVRRHSR